MVLSETLYPTLAKHFHAIKHIAQGQFLGWLYPVERDLFVMTDKYLGVFTSRTFSMDDIIPWEAVRYSLVNRS